jgi:pyruvate/2-oxoglutarate dehydrogenase complex dihydrolipoamide dehydrogenase (E3) component
MTTDATTPPTEESYDFAIIGGGSAGYAAARTAHGLGLSVVVIDGAETLGGLCILRGCMPSKALIETADRALNVRRAAEFAVETTGPRVNTHAMRERKRALIEDFASYRQGQLTDGRFSLRRGNARFTSPHTLTVTPREPGPALTVRFRTALIASGSHLWTPDVPGLAEAGFWTSDTVLDAADVPASFVVLGGGAIALEMAHFLDGIGRQVTVIQRSAQLLTGLDPELGDTVATALIHRGLGVHTGTQLLRVEVTDAGKTVVFRSEAGPEQSVTAAEILVALGRHPATASLGLEAAEVETQKGRVLTLATQQTSQPHIFAAGDVCGPLEVVHLAIQQGEMAARHAAQWLRGEKASERMDYRLQLFGVFTHPQVAAVGLSEIAAQTEGRTILTASYPFNDHGKSMVMGETEGFVKMIADAATGEILGASVVGPQAVELIHTVAAAMHFRSTVQQFLQIPFYHPTLSEIWSYPAEEIADALAASMAASSDI